ncbi:non-canonical purine NTP pyrophosphatase [Candidatus Pacearchaeota archaeon]|nr:non-canonical purine NTP pyrophosphatase [Candidatus Pacearchaeota archaeon]
MVNLYFITGNRNKFVEAKSVIANVEQIDLDLPEIQEIDAHKIIEEKLKKAVENNSGEFFCEDTSLYINCLNGLPGPLIKWFLEALGVDGIYNLIEKYPDKSAVAKTIIGYINGNNIAFFEGEVRGSIVSPRGESDFGWDKIFQPEDSEKTFGEMDLEEKNNFSMRKKALIRLKNYLDEVKK